MFALLRKLQEVNVTVTGIKSLSGECCPEIPAISSLEFSCEKRLSFESVKSNFISIFLLDFHKFSDTLYFFLFNINQVHKIYKTF